MESTAALLLLLSSYAFLLAAAPPPPRPSAPPILPKESLPTKSGYLTVNASTGSAIFYAFYEAQQHSSPPSQTPLLIWLQGGPGCSSMIGNFYELGPWRVTASSLAGHDMEHLSLEPNPGSWNRIFGLLFLDNPIGVGFSFAATTEEIPRDQHSVAEHLFTAITGFLKLDAEYQSRPIYITGESYAGKYVPAIGYYILKKNWKLPVSQKVHLSGVAIGNGLTDPVTQVTTQALNAYYSGLINEKQKGELEEAQSEALRLIRMANWSEAADARSHIWRLLENMTGLATLYDFTKKVPYRTEWVARLLQSKEVKAALGARASIEFKECSDLVGSVLHADVMKTVKPMVEYMVGSGLRVLLYQGHSDLMDGVYSTEAWVRTMKWDGIERFMSADRKVWRVKGELAGFVQKWGSLSHAVVMGAGHLVPTDQPLNSQAMIEDWVLEKGLFGTRGEF
ncbi:serine carboxypeptidase-like 50 [Punica granatum]|uniref:Carboxypeptidase n=2 Tax=Punica granatum TaxID=22663 RepID=A0A218XLT5_PUNGR|nr:serine carboxypeptidase-like 50 [Punica granatum]OWM86215.1 hypothetical protein CDL15_Pgr011039 [Punica granatum]PKI44232.1 hypothetical protein CRG98_035306 [Punica granatum]